MFKKWISILLTFCIASRICLSTLTVGAAQISAGIITIDTVSGITGDTIVVPIRMSENPGIISMTVSITYNAEALQFEKYYPGDVVYDYYVVDHPDKNLLRFVNCEKKDINNNGTILSLQFKIKENAEADFHKIDLVYSAGDFCNWNLDKIMPEIVSGGVEVAFNGNNCKHKKYGDWTVAAQATCKEGGVEQRICKTCGHIELRDTESFGHDYSEEFTIDKAANDFAEGIKSKHCSRCDDVIDMTIIPKTEVSNEDLVTVRISLLTHIIYDVAYDYSGDGVIDVRDLVRLKRYLAGEKVALGPDEA